MKKLFVLSLFLVGCGQFATNPPFVVDFSGGQEGYMAKTHIVFHNPFVEQCQCAEHFPFHVIPLDADENIVSRQNTPALEALGHLSGLEFQEVYFHVNEEIRYLVFLIKDRDGRSGCGRFSLVGIVDLKRNAHLDITGAVASFHFASSYHWANPRVANCDKCVTTTGNEIFFRDADNDAGGEKILRILNILEEGNIITPNERRELRTAPRRAL
jgi:hypothetical protein